jgi:hypothetical protein
MSLARISNTADCEEATNTLYDKDIVSVEARTMDGSSPETRGSGGVRKKVDWWLENMQVHSAKVSGPFVAHDRFVVQYDIDVIPRQIEPHGRPRLRIVHHKLPQPLRMSGLFDRGPQAFHFSRRVFDELGFHC